MYLDDSYYAYESVKSAHTEPVLVADKKQPIRIIKEHHSKSFKTKLIVGLMFILMFVVLSGWNSMITPMVMNG